MISQPDFDKIDGQLMVASLLITAFFSKFGDYACCLCETTPGQGDFWPAVVSTVNSTIKFLAEAVGDLAGSRFRQSAAAKPRSVFTFDASKDQITSVTQYGGPLGIDVGDQIPTATDALAGAYGVVSLREQHSS